VYIWWMPLHPLTRHIQVNIHGISNRMYVYMVGSTRISEKISWWQISILIFLLILMGPLFFFLSSIQIQMSWAQAALRDDVISLTDFTRKSINYGFLFRIMVLTCSRELFCTSMIANITSGMKARWIHKLDPTCNINRCIIFTSWIPVRCHGPIKLD
jgi:hypothetical protein